MALAFYIDYAIYSNIKHIFLSFQFVRPAFLDKNLDCIFLHHEDPFLKIGPFKYEFLNKGPSIGLVHDMISNKHTERIKENAKSTLKSTPYNSGEGYSTYSRLAW